MRVLSPYVYKRISQQYESEMESNVCRESNSNVGKCHRQRMIQEPTKGVQM